MAFLRQHHPFSELDDDGLAAVRTALTIVHVPAGDAILTEGGAPADAVGLIRKGELELSTGVVVVDLLEPGDVFGLTSVMTGQVPTMTVRAVEDSLCYLLPARGGPTGAVERRGGRPPSGRSRGSAFALPTRRLARSATPIRASRGSAPSCGDRP